MMLSTFFTTLLVGLSVPPPTFAQSLQQHSILQGSTARTTAHFTVVARATENLKISVSGRPADASTIVTEPGSEWVVHRLRFSELPENELLELKVENGDGVITDLRQFSTLNPDQPNARVALLSCLLRQLHNPWMWSALENKTERPDLLLFIGDSVYLDRDSLLFSQSPQTSLQAWESFAAARNTLAVYFWPTLVPSLAIWDDHDAGGNNVNGHFPLLGEIRRIYETFFANDTIPGFVDHGPGLAKRISLSGKNLILLDGRSFRDLSVDAPMFGWQQENWLLDNLRSGDNVIINGTQFFGGFIKKDSYESNYFEDFQRFLEKLRTTGNQRSSRIIFASGDVHFSEVQKLEASALGYPTYELTSSSAHSFAAPGHYLLKPSNPRRIAANGTHNVLLLEWDTARGSQQPFSVRSLGWRGNTRFQVDLFAPVECELALSE